MSDLFKRFRQSFRKDKDRTSKRPKNNNEDKAKSEKKELINSDAQLTEILKTQVFTLLLFLSI